MLKIVNDETGRETALGITVRVAGSSYGEPVCIEPESRVGTMSVSIYVNDGNIVGVVVLDTKQGEDNPDTYRIGLVPGEATEERE